MRHALTRGLRCRRSGRLDIVQYAPSLRLRPARAAVRYPRGLIYLGRQGVGSVCVTPGLYRDRMAQLTETFRFGAKCSPSQHRRLVEVCGMCSELYNACLESWRGTYAWWREHHPDGAPLPRDRSQSHFDRLKMFTGVRRDCPEWSAVSVKVGRGVLRRFHRAERSLYKRCQTGKRPGYPRFKSRHRWRTIEIPDVSPSMLVPPGTRKNRSDRWWRLAVKGLPRLRFRDKGNRLATALGCGARVVELRVVRTALRVEVHAVVKHSRADNPPAEEPVRPVGVDVGLRSRRALSDGTTVGARQPDRGTIKRRQRALSRAVKGSRGRAKKRSALAKAWRRETERARQADYRLVHHLISSYDGVAVEDLNVAGMLRAKMFSRQISDQRWAALTQILEHKAEKAGIPYVRVNPANTTTDCSHCGHRQPMPLGARVYACGDCGMVMCRDVNAARNICARAFPGSGGTLPDAMRTTNFRHKTHDTSREPWADGHRRTVSPEQTNVYSSI